ncbi:MAG: hypothetical protein R3F17_10925 [Planctomycetota bacterium]
MFPWSALGLCLLLMRGETELPAPRVYLDLGDGATCAAHEGAAAQVPGGWNRVDSSGGEAWTLTAFDGARLGLTSHGVEAWVQCRDDQALGDLLGDGAHGGGDGQRWSLSGLAPGWYGLILYADPLCQATPSAVSVEAGTPPARCAVSQAPGLGQVFVVRAREGRLAWTVAPAAPEADARLMAAQVVQLAGPGQPRPQQLSRGARHLLWGSDGRGGWFWVLGGDGSPLWYRLRPAGSAVEPRWTVLPPGPSRWDLPNALACHLAGATLWLEVGSRDGLPVQDAWSPWS